MLFSVDHIFFLVNRRIPFSFLVNNGVISQKYSIVIVFKSLLEQKIAKAKVCPVISLREACHRSALRAYRTAQKAEIESVGATLRTRPEKRSE
jgi:hypothetical protein